MTLTKEKIDEKISDLNNTESLTTSSVSDSKVKKSRATKTKKETDVKSETSKKTATKKSTSKAKKDAEPKVTKTTKSASSKSAKKSTSKTEKDVEPKATKTTKSTSSKSTKKSTSKTEKDVEPKATKTTKSTSSKSTKKSTSKTEKDVEPKATKTKRSTKSSSTKTEKKATTKSTKRTTKKSEVSNASEKNVIKNQIEYYDLPYRYNQTIVKILAQTPNSIFVYWDIADEDVSLMKQKYGENIFNDTVPVLLVHNETLNQSFEIEIDDFANSWYLNIPASDCVFNIELGRRKIADRNETIINSNDNTVHIASSNNLQAPNDHILYKSLGKNVLFKNVKTNETEKVKLSTLKPITNLFKFYENEILNNPSSAFGL